MHCMYTLTSYIDTNNITMITESNSMKNNNNEKTLRDANTASALAVVRFGVSPLGRPARCKHTDRTDNNTLRCS